MKTFAALPMLMLPLLPTAAADEPAIVPSANEINRQGWLERTPLMQAVRRGSADEVRALLAAGADPNIPEWRRNTPLMHACQYGYTDIVRMLLAAGADVNARDDEGWTALMGVCVSKKNPTTEIAEMLLAAGADITPADSRHGHTALTYAAKSGKAAHVALLLKAGADPNARAGRSSYDGTVLVSAVYCKASPETLRALIAAGADVNKGLDEPGAKTPLAAAVWTGDADSVRTLLEAGAIANPPGNSYLCDAAAEKDTRVLQMLLAAGADANAPCADGCRPLSIAACAGSVGNAAHVRILLAAGARADAEDARGYTALMGAARAKNPESLRLLLAAGAPVNHCSRKGETALMLAAKAGNWAQTEALLAAGADKTLRNEKNQTATDLIFDKFFYRMTEKDFPLELEENHVRTFCLLAADGASAAPGSELAPLMRAVLLGDARGVNAAIAGGADVNATTAMGRTALHMAADYLLPDMLELLLKAGADAQARDLSGNTALMLAQLAGRGYLQQSVYGDRGDAQARCTELLLAAGADARAANHAGQDALMLACYRRSLNADTDAAIRMLLAAGADINSRDKEGRTPLMYSLMQMDSGRLFTQLTALGADINARDTFGRTPLMYAVQSGYISDDSWQRLMAAKPDKQARDHAGKQAIDYARPGSKIHKRLLGAP